MRYIALPKVEKDIRHFSLDGLFPAGHTLILNTTLGTLSQVYVRDGVPCMVQEQQFTHNERALLLPLLESFPFFCSYEMLLAHFTYDNVTEARITECRTLLQGARTEGIWDQEMRPVRTLLSRTRLKTRPMGIELSAILETGYILTSRRTV